MTQPESRLSRRIMEALRAEGVFCFKVHGTKHMMAGLPDIICCVDGIFVALETKMPGMADNVTPRQEYVHTKIREADGYVHVITSVDEARRVVADVRSQAHKHA